MLEKSGLLVSAFFASDIFQSVSFPKLKWFLASSSWMEIKCLIVFVNFTFDWLIVKWSRFEQIPTPPKSNNSSILIKVSYSPCEEKLNKRVSEKF